jgi:hypothetical protein
VWGLVFDYCNNHWLRALERINQNQRTTGCGQSKKNSESKSHWLRVFEKKSESKNQWYRVFEKKLRIKEAPVPGI